MDLIFSAFATLEGHRESAHPNQGRAVYDRGLVVGVASARACHPVCRVALVTNASVPEPYAGQLPAAGVEVLRCPFDSFRFPADLPWSLAFYKLCALRWVLAHTGCDRCLMLDADTYTQRPLDDLWREADQAVLLYQVEHPASQPMAAAISRRADALDPAGAPHCLTHYGGELVAGRADRLRAFADRCAAVYGEMTAAGVLPEEGDEAILAIAAWRSALAGEPVRSANAYLARYWLGARFYFVSTGYCLTPLCVLHLPGQAKNRQLLLLYRYYTRRGHFPPDRTVWRWCGLPAARPPLLTTLFVRLRARLPF